MQYKIGIFGSAIDNLESSAVKRVRKLGQLLAKHDVVVITGACSGVPYQVAYEAAQNGLPVWGYSPEKDLIGQKKFTPNDDLSIYKKIIYTPKSFPLIKSPDACKKYRNVISTANCDAGIIISGRWGSMNEFTNLYDMGKVIGVLTKTGGIADELASLNKKILKPGKAILIFADSPEKLVHSVMEQLRKRDEL